MLQSIWDSISQHSPRRWLIASVVPAFVGWTATAWTYSLWRGIPPTLAAWTALQEPERLLLTGASITLVLLTAFALDLLGPTLLLWTAGQWDGLSWWGRRLQRRARNRQIEQVGPKRRERRGLALRALPPDQVPEPGALIQEPREPLSADEEQTYLRLDTELHEWPAEGQEQATRIGNILRAASEHPLLRYGLDPYVTWPRLYYLLPEPLRSGLEDARASLEAHVRFACVSVVFTLSWGALALANRTVVPTLATLVGLLTTWLVWRATVQAAAVYGELVRTAYDVHRFALYDALSLPRPHNSAAEKLAGEELAAFLWRGSGTRQGGFQWTFKSPPATSEEPKKS